MEEQDFNLPEDYMPEIEDSWAPLNNLLNSLPKDRIHVINPQRFAEAVKSINIIKSTIDTQVYDVKYDLRFDDLTGTSLVFFVVVKYDFGTGMLDDLAEALKSANMFSVTTNLDEEITMAFEYHGVRKLFAPKNEK